MNVEFTVESFIAYLKDLYNEDRTFGLSKPCAFSTLRLQLELTSPSPSHKTLDQCLLIGLRCLPTHYYKHHITRVADVLTLLLLYGAKWDGSTLLDKERTPYHIICQTSSDPYELLDLMIISSRGKLMNEPDSEGCTAVIRAVQFKNVECLRCLVAHGADLHLGNNPKFINIMPPLFRAIRAHSVDPCATTRDIVNLLLESKVDINKPRDTFGRLPIQYAIDQKNIDCFEKLAQNGAKFEPIPLLFRAERDIRIDVLECLINLGFSKNVTDSFGRNALYHAVCNRDITFIRYLLEAGVTIHTTEEQQHYRPSYQETSSRMMNLHKGWYNSCLQAITMDMLDVVQLMENYDQQTFQSMEALKCAVRRNSLKMVNYLLRKYKYPINMEYRDIDRHTTQRMWNWSQTIITEACKPDHLEIVTLLMEHGADPAKKSDDKRYQSAVMLAIKKEYNDLVAHFIRSGVNLDCRLHDRYLGDVLPFEYAVIRCNKPAAEMLLHAGCSCGEFSLVNNIPTGITSSIGIGYLQRFVSVKFQMLMIEWNMHKNNVRPLHQLCRKSIRKHLFPRAVKKITELPLPSMIIRYLSTPGFEE